MSHSMAADPLNVSVAGQLDEVAELLEERGDNPFRVQAYRNAANTIRRLSCGIDDILASAGLAGLDRLPGIGPAIARLISQTVTTGRLPMLQRLRAEADPIALLRSLPGIGATLARRLHDDLGIQTLDELETAADDGTLAQLSGFGDKRIAGIRAALGARLARRRTPWASDRVSIAELLDVDREYLDATKAGTLPRIAPKRFNPSGSPWLPVLHTWRGGRRYTALFPTRPAPTR